MGHQLSRIGTKTGDLGQTSFGGMRVDKDSPPIETLGAIDELNSWIGVLVALSTSQEVRQIFTSVQHDLFDLNAQISVHGTVLLSRTHLSRIEESFERINSELGTVKEFILPGGAVSSAFAHVARSVCRRAERRLFSLTEIASGPTELLDRDDNRPLPETYGLPYLNRLSDLLFVASLLENRSHGDADVFSTAISSSVADVSNSSSGSSS